MLKKVCPDDIPVPANSQLEALSEEVAAVGVDSELAELVWGLELAFKARFPDIPITDLAQTPAALEISAALLALAAISNGDHIYIRSSKPCIAWLVAVAYKVFGFRTTFQAGSNIIWESSVVQQGSSVLRGTVLIHYIERKEKGVFRESSSPGNEVQVLREASVELSLNRLETGAYSSLSIPIADGVLLLLTQGGRINKEEHDAAIRETAKAVLSLRGSLICWDGSSRHVLNEAEMNYVVFNPSSREILQYCQRIYPDTSLTMEELDNMPVSDLSAPKSAGISIVHDPWEHILKFDRTKKHPLDRVEAVRRETQVAITLVLLSMFFIQSSTPLRLDSLRLRQMIMGGGRSRNYPAIFSIVGSSSPGNSHVRFVYHAFIDHMLSLFHGPHQAEDLSFDSRTIASTGPAGLTSGGRYTVLSTVIDPCRDIESALKLIHGDGGIFINSRCINKLQSQENSVTLEEKTGHPRLRDFRADYNIDEHALRGYANQQEGRLSPYDCPKTNLAFDMRLWESQRPLATKISWSVTARSGIELPVDVQVSPHGIIFHQIGYKRCDWAVGPFTKRSKGEFMTRNIESYLCPRAMKNTGLEMTIVYTGGSRAVGLLAICFARPGLIIRHTPNMNMGESMKRLEAFGYGTIIVEGEFPEAGSKLITG